MSRWVIVICLVTLGSCVVSEGPEGITDADSVARLRLEDELRIGHRDDPNLGFSRIDEIDVDRDGLIYVFETLPPEIRVFSPSGERVGTIGRSGQGPGELTGPRFSFGVHGDTIWVIDLIGARRITLYNRAGDVLSTGIIRDLPIEMNLPGQSASVVPFEMDEDGLFAAELGPVLVTRESDIDSPTPPPAVSTPRVRFDASGAVFDTVGSTTNFLSRRPGSLAWLAVADGEIEASLVHDSSLPESTFRVSRTNSLGDTISSRTFHFREVDSPAGPLNPISQIRVVPDGAVWLRRENVEAADSLRWLMLDQQLVPVGQVTLPRVGYRVEWSRGDTILAVVSDSIGVHWVVRSRLVPSP